MKYSPRNAPAMAFETSGARLMPSARVRLLSSAVLVVGLVAAAAAQRAAPPARDWPAYGGDPGGRKYSALTTITRENVSQLTKAWEWKTGETPIEALGTFPGAFQNTPLMIDDVLYLSTPYNKAVALEAGTGRELWSFDPKAYADGQPASGQGFVHRGVAAWRDRGALRIFLNSRYRLFCLDAKTGQPVKTFGQEGSIDISQGLIWAVNRKHYAQTSPPVVYRDLVILGNGVGDRLMYRNDPPGDVRAFDARTGKLVWAFHPIPQPGEFGHETWKDGSWKFTGHTNVWAPMSLDAERGLVYLPVSTPSNDYYGGRRRGSNLFAESLVCLDANTGRRKWHFQIVHHGLWDYDPASPPNLVTITVGGRRIDAVVQLTKQGFAFVFDRVTGRPVWPIEERPVPQDTDVPGEEPSPTQPFPTRPVPFVEQGVSIDDAFDLTPELQAKAVEELKKFRLGPVYTPPTMQGTFMRPGVWGGANWGGAAFDPETATLYFKVTNQGQILRIEKRDPNAPTNRPGEVDADYVNRGQPGWFMDGLPLTKPPYARIVAMDLSTGTIRWQVPFGDHPAVRELLVKLGVTPPPVIGAPGPPGVIATRSGLLFVGGGDRAFHALDARDGRDLWSVPTLETTGTPMTYATADGRQFVVVATGRGREATLVAFSLPS
jgi:quinoprotein glucose dehydrogenase